MIDPAQVQQIFQKLPPNPRAIFQAFSDSGFVDWISQVQPLIMDILVNYPQRQSTLVNATSRPLELSVLTQDFQVPEVGHSTDAVITSTSWVTAGSILAMSSITGWQYLLVDQISDPITLSLTNLDCPGTVADDIISAGNFVTFRIPDLAHS